MSMFPRKFIVNGNEIRIHDDYNFSDFNAVVTKVYAPHGITKFSFFRYSVEKITDLCIGIRKKNGDVHIIHEHANFANSSDEMCELVAQYMGTNETDLIIIDGSRRLIVFDVTNGNELVEFSYLPPKNIQTNSKFLVLATEKTGKTEILTIESDFNRILELAFVREHTREFIDPSALHLSPTYVGKCFVGMLTANMYQVTIPEISPQRADIMADPKFNSIGYDFPLAGKFSDMKKKGKPEPKILSTVLMEKINVSSIFNRDNDFGAVKIGKTYVIFDVPIKCLEGVDIAYALFERKPNDDYLSVTLQGEFQKEELDLIRQSISMEVNHDVPPDDRIMIQVFFDRNEKGK